MTTIQERVRENKAQREPLPSAPGLAESRLIPSTTGTDLKADSVTELHALVYVSKASRSLSSAELQHLLERARARNFQEGVTGVLLYSHRNFIQYLEGPAAGVAKVYGVIKADPLHHGIIELMNEPIPLREFADWSMAFRDISAFGMASPPGINAVFEAAASMGSRHASAGHVLLSKFWNKGSVGQ